MPPEHTVPRSSRRPDLIDLVQAIRTGRTSARAALEAQLERIDEVNGVLNAIVWMDPDGARHAADAADKAIAGGLQLGPLHGVAITIKDTFDVAGMPCTAGTIDLRDRIPDSDAEAVRRLRSAGAIVIGKTNTPAFAGDAQTDSELFGRTDNPWDPARTPGGSSGGAAAAVATGMVPLELGSDAAGSVRIPAHCCGIVALKPSAGLVPLSGHLPPPPGRPDLLGFPNVAGPIARRVRDLRLAMEVLGGVRTTSAEHRPDGRRYRIGWAEDFVAASGSDVRIAIAGAARALRTAGHDLVPLAPETLEMGRAREAHLAISRVNEHTWYGKGPAPSFEHIVTVMGDRELIAAELDRRLEGFDAWLLPILPIVAPRHTPFGSAIEVDGLLRPYFDVLIEDCRPFNLTGHPSCAVPVAVTPEGLPVGVQLVGHRWRDAELLDVAETVESVIAFEARPPI